MYKRGKGIFNGRLKNKKAQDEIWETLTLMTGAAVGIFFVIVIFRFSSTEKANMTFFTKDAAMLTDSILASPQNVELVYSNEYPNSSALYSGSEIQLFSGLDASSGESAYRGLFIPMKRITMGTTASQLNVIYFLKNESFMTISTQPWTVVANKEQEQSTVTPILTPEEEAEREIIRQLYQAYLPAQNLCFKTLNECTTSIKNNYAEPCKEFECFCFSSQELSGGGSALCDATQPFIVMARNIPEWINK